MRKTKRKGFTIVELVIVIAIIAILAAVLIPTFSSIIKKANYSADMQVVKNLNTALTIEKADSKVINTANDAFNVVEEYGYNVDRIVSKSDYEIAYDVKGIKFVLLDKYAGEYVFPTPDSITEGKIGASEMVNYFVVAKTLNDAQGKDKDNNDGYYSVYVSENWKGGNEVELDGFGFDAGKNTDITSVTYKNTGNDAKDVVIRTNGGKLIINDTVEGNKQTHYGTADNVEVTTAMTSFHTHGKIYSMTLNAGKVVAEDNGFVYLVEVAAASEGVTQLAQEEGGVIVIPAESTTTTIKNANAVKDLGYTVTETGTTVSADRESKTTYTISSKSELLEYVKNVNSGDYFGYIPTKLTADIDISGYEWTPIGNWEHPWFGTFNGNGHKIIGLTASVTVPFEDENDSYEPVYTANSSVGYGVTFGFFGIVGNGDVEISNVEFASTNINLSNGKNVGSVIGFAPSTSKFGSDASMNAGVGNTQCSKLAVDNVKTSGTVSGAAHVGGLIGKIYTKIDVAISNCENTAAVTVSKSGGAGGVVACVSGTTSITFTSCKNSGTITRLAGASAFGTAGIIGNSAVAMTLDLCTNSGTIINNSTAEQNNANGTTAGIAGNVKNTDLTVKNCSNSGAVTSKSNGAAGIIGGNATYGFNKNIKLQGTISNTGTITAANYASGIIGLVSTASKTAKNVLEPTIDITSLTSITYKGSLNTTVVGGVTADYLCYKGGAGIFKSMSDTTTTVVK